MRARAWGASVCLIGTEEQEEDIFAQSPRAKAQTEALPWFAPPILEDQKSVVKEEKLNAFKLKLDPAQALASIPEQIRDSLAAGIRPLLRPLPCNGRRREWDDLAARVRVRDVAARAAAVKEAAGVDL